MLGGGGCIRASQPFLEMLRERTKRHGAVLIFDEVMTSRLSPSGLQAVVGITPDMTTLGKYVGGGMSFGAFGGREDLMARFDPRKPQALPHAGTFNNNVLTMSAGIAALSEVYTPEAAGAINAVGEALRARLNDIAARHDVAMQFTGYGSMMAVHTTRGPVLSPRDAARSDPGTKDLLFFDLQKAGIWIARRGMVVLSLPLTAADCDAFAAAVEEFAVSRRHLLA
jgi:glutamate-1-semialdehyde 2,1-aminomutase